MDDIRYSEFLFLRGIDAGQIERFSYSDRSQCKALGLKSLNMYLEMVIGALEDLHIKIEDQNLQRLALKLRGDEMPDRLKSASIHSWQWDNPREGLESALQSNSSHRVTITYRGLQRIEELREKLQRDRILEDFGVLLDIRYFRRDLEDALKRPSDTSVTVIYADMDRFKAINDNHTHLAGDIVMKKYLECVRDGLGQLGTGYRKRGDETVGLIVGQDAGRVRQIADDIHRRVATLECEYNGVKLPQVTASIGVATTPPANRTMELESLADQRQDKAKKGGRNRVVSE